MIKRGVTKRHTSFLTVKDDGVEKRNLFGLAQTEKACYTEGEKCTWLEKEVWQ